MTNQKHHLREAIFAALPDIAQHLPLDCEMFVVAVRPGESDFDLVLPSPESNLNNTLDALRRNGLSIDGDNAYKRDLCDLICGAMAFGKQNTNPPPAGHWGERFWEIGRAEGELQEELVQALVPLLAHWADLAPGDSLNVDRARVAIAKATGTTPPSEQQLCAGKR